MLFFGNQISLILETYFCTYMVSTTTALFHLAKKIIVEREYIRTDKQKLKN